MVFILIGIWHGAELNYFAFGVMNALGIVGNFYYGLFLKKRLTKEQLRWYNGNRYVHAVCVVVNFVFVCATLFLFANSIEQMKSIIHAIW
jgi:D-alanyl-lipoteichoic acid acyltransferase DltB (MBOAT superfamily)